MIVILDISPMECAGCIQQIEDHLLQQEAVESVHVFPQVGKVRIEMDPSKTTKEQLEKSLATLHFPILSMKSNREKEEVTIV